MVTIISFCSFLPMFPIFFCIFQHFRVVLFHPGIEKAWVQDEILPKVYRTLELSAFAELAAETTRNESGLIFDQTITNCCLTVKNRCYDDVKLASVLILLSISPTSARAIISTSFVLESSTARVTPIKSQQQNNRTRSFRHSVTDKARQ